jgi:hypothetical protein
MIHISDITVAFVIVSRCYIVLHPPVHNRCPANPAKRKATNEEVMILFVGGSTVANILMQRLSSWVY